MHEDTAARVRRAHRIRIWTGIVVVLVGFFYAFGNPLWGGRNTTLEIVIGLALVVFGALNIVLSAIGLRRLRDR